MGLIEEVRINKVGVVLADAGNMSKNRFLIKIKYVLQPYLYGFTFFTKFPRISINSHLFVVIIIHLTIK